MGKSNKFLSKAEVAARYTGETKYNSVTVPQVFTAGEESIIDSASASLLKELDTITIIANKQILGKSEWSDVGNTSGVAPTTTTTTTAAPNVFTPSSSTVVNSISSYKVPGEKGGGTSFIANLNVNSTALSNWYANNASGTGRLVKARITGPGGIMIDMGNYLIDEFGNLNPDIDFSNLVDGWTFTDGAVITLSIITSDPSSGQAIDIISTHTTTIDYASLTLYPNAA